MAEFSNEPTPSTVKTIVHTTKERSGSNAIHFILGGIVVAVAVLWYAFSGGNLMSVVGDLRAPSGGSNVTIENYAAPAPAPSPAPAHETSPAPVN
ncbi:MAG: hypothetical protein Q8P60_10025 [Pseudorhodobacter sp.]|nr:hypothetical protein [Pseudorhodobacter sp.]